MKGYNFNYLPQGEKALADKNKRIRRRVSSGYNRSVERTSLKMGANFGEEQIKRRNPSNQNLMQKQNKGIRADKNKFGKNGSSKASVTRVSSLKDKERRSYDYNDREAYSSNYFKDSYDRERRTSFDYQRETPSRKNKQKQAKRNSGVEAKKFAFVFFAVVFIYMCVVVYNGVSRETIPYDTVAYGSIDTPKSAVGIAVRDEAVYKAPSDGTLSFNVSDMQKVRKGESICSIKNDAVVGSMEEELENINKSILKIQDSRDDLSVFSEDVKRINSQIKSIVDENAFDMSIGNLDKVYYLKDSIKKKIDTKNQMLLSESGGSLQELADKRVQRESEINKNTTVVSALEGGIISYSFDELQEVLSIDKLEALTEEQTLMKQDDNKVEQASGQVKKNSGIFKIVNSNNWYIASYIPNDYVTEWEEGDNRTIYIKGNGESTPMEVKVQKLVQGNKKTYVIFALTKDILNYINARSITFELNKAQNGYKINNNAIVEIHSFKVPISYIRDDGVILKKNKSDITETVVSISGTDKNGQFAYIPVEYGSISANDEIINPNNENDVYKISEMETTKGVYVINTGVTQFKTIDLDNSVQNSTHTILDPDKNTNIKVYDRIVTDIKNVSKEQKIYS